MTLAPVGPASATLNDDDLLALVAAGGRAAFTVLHDRISGRVLGLVKRVLVDAAQSEEVTQDVFLEVWQTASRFDPAKGKAVSWVMTVAHRRAVDRVRASQSSRTRDLTVGMRDFEHTPDDFAETVDIQVEHERMRAAMRGLNRAHQQALDLTYFQGLTNKEAALAAGIPIGTLKSRLRDSLITLRTLVGVTT